MRRIVVFAMVLSLPLSGALDSPPGDAARSRRANCLPPHTRTLLMNREARVYARKPGYDSPGHGFDIFGCAFSTGERYELDDIDGLSAFTPPALSLAGPLIGYALNYFPNDGDIETYVFSHDLRRSTYDHVVHRLASINPGAVVVKVGSLRVTRRGSLAWITCPDSQYRTDTQTARRAPHCIRPGRLDRVIALTAGSTSPRLLDKGYEIDPSSLRLDGHRLSWRHSGRLRHATLR
jgi:hypothetical protein